MHAVIESQKKNLSLLFLTVATLAAGCGKQDSLTPPSTEGKSALTLPSANRTEALFAEWKPRLDAKTRIEVDQELVIKLEKQCQADNQAGIPLVSVEGLTASGFRTCALLDHVADAQATGNKAAALKQVIAELLRGIPAQGTTLAEAVSTDFRYLSSNPNFVQRILSTCNATEIKCGERSALAIACAMNRLENGNWQPEEHSISVNGGIVFDKVYAVTGESHAWVRIGNLLFDPSVTDPSNLVGYVPTVEARFVWLPEERGFDSKLFMRIAPPL